MTWMPAQLLVILALPAATWIVGRSWSGLPETLLSLGFAYCIAAATLLAIQAWPRSAAPDVEANIDRISTLYAYAIACVVGAVACLAVLFSPIAAISLLAVAAMWVVVWWPQATRLYVLTSTIVIARDPATVFAFVSDARNGPKYYEAVDETIEKIGEGPIALGTQFRSHSVLHAGKVPGLKADFSLDSIEEIVGFEPNHRVMFRVNRRRPNLATITLESVAGGTQLTHRFEYLHPYAVHLLGHRFRKRDVDAYQREMRHAAWARAKEILENETP